MALAEVVDIRELRLVKLNRERIDLRQNFVESKEDFVRRKNKVTKNMLDNITRQLKAKEAEIGKIETELYGQD